MPPTLATESATVQDPLVRYAGTIGWEIVPQSEAVGLRKGEGGMFFYNLLEETLLQLNPGIITPENLDDVIRRLEGVRNSIEGNAEILAWLRGERSVHVAGEKRQRQVRLIDYGNVDLRRAAKTLNVPPRFAFGPGDRRRAVHSKTADGTVPLAAAE